MSKTALITGASRGIGKEIARALADNEHQVIALARTEEKLRELQDNYPDHIRFLAIDITRQNERERLIQYLAKHNLEINILINNAGALIKKTFMELTSEDWDQMLQVNLLAPVHLIKALIPKMNSGSHIVNIGSMGGFQGSSKFPGLTGYSVAKGAISILSECLAVELADKQISVNALCLGSVETEMFNEAFPGLQADVSPGDMGTYIANFALNGATFYNGRVLPVALNDPS